MSSVSRENERVQAIDAASLFPGGLCSSGSKSRNGIQTPWKGRRSHLSNAAAADRCVAAPTAAAGRRVTATSVDPAEARLPSPGSGASPEGKTEKATVQHLFVVLPASFKTNWSSSLAHVTIRNHRVAS